MAVNLRAVVITCCVVSVLVWVVGLAGMAAVTSDCHKDLSAADCARGLQYEWWGLWFQFFLLLVVAALAVRDRLEAHQLTLLTFLAICTSVLMWSARSLMARGSFADLTSTRDSAKNAASAGYVLLCLCNFLLIILLGSGGRVEAAASTGGNGYGSNYERYRESMVATPANGAPMGAYQAQV